MDPVTVIAIAQGISALGQMYEAEKAAGASRKRLKDLERAFGQLKPPSMRVTIDQAGTLSPEYLAERVPPVDYDMSSIPPEVYEAVGEYKPDALKFFPGLPNVPYITPQAGETGKQAQLTALQEMQRIASGETPDYALREQLFKTRQAADLAGQQRQESILRDFARRQMLGAGTQQLAQLQAAGDVTNRQAAADVAAGAESYRNRLNMLSQSAALGGTVKEQERAFAARNADLINDFNRRMSEGYQDYLYRQNALSNQAQLMNLQQRQRIAEKNVASQAEAARYNQQKRNALMEAQRQQEIGERTRYLGGQQQDYANRFQQLAAQKGLTGMGMEMDIGYGKQRAGAYQGLGDAATKMAYYSMLKDKADTIGTPPEEEEDLVTGGGGGSRQYMQP